MKFTLCILLVLSVVGFAGGQLLLKSALAPSKSTQFSRPAFATRFVGAIALMTVSFFVSLGLMQRFELSYLYPFQGLNVLIIAAGSVLLLHEKLTLRLCAALLIITLGIALVFMS